MTTYHPDSNHPRSEAFVARVYAEIEREHRSGGSRWPSPVRTMYGGKLTDAGERLGLDPAAPVRFPEPRPREPRPALSPNRAFGLRAFGVHPEPEIFADAAVEWAVKRLHEAGRVTFLRRLGYVWVIPATGYVSTHDGDEVVATPGADGPTAWARL